MNAFCSESQRDSVIQPRVASLLATLGNVLKNPTTLKGLRPLIDPAATTPLGLKNILFCFPKVGARRANLGLIAAIPLGLLIA